MKYPNAARTGKFYVTFDVVMEHPTAMHLIGSKIVITHAQAHLMNQCVHYEGYSDLFRERDMGEEPPAYLLALDAKGGLQCVEDKGGWHYSSWREFPLPNQPVMENPNTDGTYADNRTSA